MVVLAAAVIGWQMHTSSASPAPLVDVPVTGARLTWDAGSNSNLPKVTTTVGASDASRVASLINATQPMGEGPYSCPMDDGSAVEAVFEASSGASQAVRIDLTGCAGPEGRFMGDALAAELHTLAPSGYYSQAG